MAQTSTLATALLDPQGNDTIHTLYKQVMRAGLSDNERQLIKAGATSKSLQVDGSIWTRLCALAFCCLGDLDPAISYNAATACFQFAAGEVNGPVHLTHPAAQSHHL